MEKKRSKQNVKSLGIYIHIPFCVKKCEYCDFLSMAAGRDVQNQYCENLLKEIELAGVEYRSENYVVDTIFIGGGTPSILEPEWIEKILGAVYANFSVAISVEITIECNPGTLDEEKLKGYKRAGVNRISLGLQSANNCELQLLGRIHTWEQFLETANLVKKHFFNWNVDLMSALPGQSVESYRETLEKVIALEPAHISAYSLIIEEGTLFYEKYEEDELLRQQGKVPKLLPDEDTERQMYEMTEAILGTAEYKRYEISNYAKSGYECRHNDRYWKREDYLGMGLGAASCMGEVRFSNTPDMKEYLQVLMPRKVETRSELEQVRGTEAELNGDGRLPREDIQKLSVKEQMEETMFLGLRRMEGVDCELFKERFGRSIQEVFGTVLPELKKQELLQYSGKYIQLTQKGIDVSNYVLAQFLLD